MLKLTAALFLLAVGLQAQPTATLFYRGVMLPSNEVPPTPSGPTGFATIVVHAILNDAGTDIVEASVDFTVRSNFPTDQTFTGLHIHDGPAGVNAGVKINTGISGTNTVEQKGGVVGEIRRQAYVAKTDTAGLDVLRGMAKDPSQYYVNIHSTEFGGGVIRAQLQKADAVVLIGQMSNENEFPPITNGVTATGTATVFAVGTWDKDGKLTSGEVTFATTYTLSAAATFTGFHIHPGLPGTSGPVVIGSTLPAGITAEANTPGLVAAPGVAMLPTEINPAVAAQVQVFNDLFTNPGVNYINIHTNNNGGGVMRAQLRKAELAQFPVTMLSSNEPSPSVTASAPASVWAATIRNEDGSVAAGVVVFEINYRFPGSIQVTGLHIHDGKPGVAGPVTIPMIANASAGFTAPTGVGNYFNFSAPIGSGQALLSLADLVKNPDAHYVNLHTAADPGGAVRAPLQAPNANKASVAAIISANQDKNATVAAPGELMAVYGSNLVKVGSKLDGWQGTRLPETYNGTSVTIGGKVARLYYLDPNQIIVAVPTDVATGAAPVVVDNGNGGGTAVNLTVADTAPAIFFAPQVAVVRSSDGALITADNPARAGEVLVIYATGLGNTTPAIPAGQLVQAGTIANTAPVTITVSGQNAAVASSVAAPNTTGVYQVTFTVPAGVTGNVPLIMRQGTTTSNTVSISVR